MLEQLNPRVVRLVNELPEVDQPNEEMVGRLFAHGGLGRALAGDDGVFRARINVPSGQYLWEPAIIVMERGGELELDFSNHEPFAYLLTGWGGWLEGFAPEMLGAPRGTSLYVFALP